MTAENDPRNPDVDPFWDALVQKVGAGPDGPFDVDIAEQRLEVGGEAPLDRAELLDIVQSVTGVELGDGEDGDSTPFRHLPGGDPDGYTPDEAAELGGRDPMKRLALWFGGAIAAAAITVGVSRPLWQGGADEEALHWLVAMDMVENPAEPMEQRNFAILTIGVLATDSVAEIRSIADAGDPDLGAEAEAQLEYLAAVLEGSELPMSVPSDPYLDARIDAGITTELETLRSGRSSLEERRGALTRLASLAAQSVYVLSNVELEDAPLQMMQQRSLSTVKSALRR